MHETGTKIVATNRRARHEYEILETIETGLVLRGSEVKSLRASKVQIADAWAKVAGHELYLHGLHIAPYSHASTVGTHEPERTRKLLAHRTEIDHLQTRVDLERLALVPLSLYFKDGRAKVELALARGRKRHDKRQAIAERDAAAEARKAMARAGRHED